MQHRPEIDGLRAIAVVPVILFHAGVPGVEGGFVGVDIFFVISGFLITGLLIGDLERQRFSLMRFYERRARRILPALFLVIAVCVPVAWLVMIPSQLREFGQSLVAVVVFLSNVLFWSEAGYFGPKAELKPLLHTWSLAVEEQFYVVFPLVLWGLWRVWRHGVVWVIVVVALASLGWSEWQWRHDPSANFYLAPSRVWELLVGSLCAFAVLRRDFGHDGLAVLGLALIALAVLTFDEAVPVPSLYALIPVGGTALVLLCATAGNRVGRLLGSPVPVAIGLVSYSAYLWHQPLFAFARIVVGPLPPMGLMLGLAALSFGLAALSWRYVEQPFRRQPRPLLPSRMALFGVSALAGLWIALIGLAMHLNDGFPGRMVERFAGDVGHGPFHIEIARNYARCTPEAVAERAIQWQGFVRCMQSKPDAPITTLLFGDSHAEHLFIGLAEALPEENVGFYTLISRPFLSNPQYAHLYDAIAANPSITTVYFGMHWSRRLAEVPEGRTLAQEVGESIDFLQTLGKRVILLGEVPAFDHTAEECKYANAASVARLCTRPIADVAAAEALYLPVLQEVARAKGVRLVEPGSVMCDAQSCSMIQGGQLLYRDTDHLNIIGSRVVARAFQSDADGG